MRRIVRADFVFTHFLYFININRLIRFFNHFKIAKISPFYYTAVYAMILLNTNANRSEI